MMTNSAADEKPDLMAPDDAAQRCLCTGIVLGVSGQL